MNITQIEGVGARMSVKLQRAGIKTTNDLLKKCSDSKGRKQVAEATGLSTKQILNWVNRADLMRVKGVGSQYSDLLEAAGVDTVKELRRRNPANLHGQMLKINAQKNLVRRPPAPSLVEAWIENAKKLESKITY